jgi:5'-3' exonuclease
MKKNILFGITVFSLISCSNHSDAPKDLVLNQFDETADIQVEQFGIPSPNEQLDLLHMLGGEMIPGIVHDLTKIDDYVGTFEMATLFGIYSADAAYMIRFDQGRKVFLNYVSALDRLGERMGIVQIYGKELVESIESAETNQELYAISSDNYLKVYGKMLEHDKDVDLALILAGGWIEIMHILFESNGDFDSNQALEESMAEQIYVLDNLIEFMGNYAEANAELAGLLSDLNEVHQLFSNLDCSSSELDVKEGETTIISGGEVCVFTADGYDEMRQKISSLRNKLIG